jgi:predicted naringenin-chalcone synthase
MNNSNPHIASFATAVPPFIASQEEIKAFIKKYYSDKLKTRSLAVIDKIFSHPSMNRRHFAIDNFETLLNEDPDKRVQRFTDWSIELSAQAIKQSLEKASLAAKDVSALIVNTCTGYLCPGISTYLLEKLGLKKSTKVYDLVGSGCGGAIPNIELCRALLKESPDAIVVSVSVEICTCTYQMEDDMSLLVSNALFADGDAAAVLWNRPQGLKLVSSRSLYATQYRDDIRLIHKNGQLYNQLTLRLPKLAAEAALQVTNELLEAQGLSVGDVKYWAFHAGGENVINEVRDAIGLTEQQLKSTRNVLANYGNLSSPTVWFVLQDLQKEGIATDNWGVMLSFGAGLSAHALLLRT